MWWNRKPKFLDVGTECIPLKVLKNCECVYKSSNLPNRHSLWLKHSDSHTTEYWFENAKMRDEMYNKIVDYMKAEGIVE